MANLVPKVNNVGTLGSSSKLWNEVHQTKSVYGTSSITEESSVLKVKDAPLTIEQDLTVAGSSLLAGVTLTGQLSLGSQRIVNVGTPSASSDAATKAYVDSVAQGLDVKSSVRAATTGPVTLATDLENGDILDTTVTLTTGDRILVKDQATASENGIYIVEATGAPTRADDLAATATAAGVFVFVEEGATNADVGFVCTTDSGSDVVGTNDLAFSQFSGAGAITAGSGLTKTGNTLDVDATIITDQTAESTNDDADLVLIYDNTASALRKMTRANFLSGASADFTSISQNVTADVTNTRTLGTSSTTWGDLYLGDFSKIYFGEDQDVEIRHIPDSGLQLTMGAPGSYEPKISIRSLADNFAGPVLELYYQDPTPVNGGIIYSITFVGFDATNNVTSYATITGHSKDTTAGSEQGELRFNYLKNGSSGTYVSFSAENGVRSPDGFTIPVDGEGIDFGVHKDVTLTHDHNLGLKLKNNIASASPSTLTMQTGDTDVALNDVVGAINFQAPDDVSGTDANLICAGIEAVAEGSFSATSNATKLSFKTAESEVAVEKMSLSSSGNLTVVGDIILDDGGSLSEAGGTAAFTFDGDGHVTKIGQDTPANGEFLKWDGTKAVWDAAGGGAGGSVPTITSASPSSTYTISTTSGIEEVFLLTPSVDITVNLPAAATAGSGYKYQIKNLSANTITVDPSGSETIDGAATFALSSQYSSITAICDGSNWFII